MAQSIVGIANLALGNIGASVEIKDLTENTAEARACNRYYETARDEVFRAFTWPFSLTVQNLALVATNPTTEWTYSYAYPSDALRFVRILGTTRNPNRSQRVSYSVGGDGLGRMLVYTDQINAQGQYIQRVTDPTFWPADFVACLGLLLSVYIAPRVTSGDPYKLRSQNQQLYQTKVDDAMSNAANEEQPDPVPPGEYLSSRDYDTGGRGTVFERLP